MRNDVIWWQTVGQILHMTPVWFMPWRNGGVENRIRCRLFCCLHSIKMDGCCWLIGRLQCNRNDRYVTELPVCTEAKPSTLLREATKKNTQENYKNITHAEFRNEKRCGHNSLRLIKCKELHFHHTFRRYVEVAGALLDGFHAFNTIRKWRPHFLYIKLSHCW